MFRKSADENERDMPITSQGPLPGEIGLIGLDRSVDLSPLFPRRPEGEKYSLASLPIGHEVVRERPARR